MTADHCQYRDCGLLLDHDLHRFAECPYKKRHPGGEGRLIDHHAFVKEEPLFLRDLPMEGITYDD